MSTNCFFFLSKAENQYQLTAPKAKCLFLHKFKFVFLEEKTASPRKGVEMVDLVDNPRKGVENKMSRLVDSQLKDLPRSTGYDSLRSGER